MDVAGATAVGVVNGGFVDDALANCCCLAVSSTGIGKVNASSGLGNGPRGLEETEIERPWDVFPLRLLFIDCAFGQLS